MLPVYTAAQVSGLLLAMDGTWIVHLITVTTDFNSMITTDFNSWPKKLDVKFNLLL